MSYVKHGMYKTPEYRAWMAAKVRCFNPNSQNFYLYGGRGISMCPEWDASFMAFYEHIGPRPSGEHSLDRIDTNGHYEPGNVRWATRSEQQKNKRPRTMCQNGLHELTPDNQVHYDGRRCKACFKARTLKPRKLQPCGTPGGYQRHRAHGEKPCVECRDGYNRTRREKNAAKRAARQQVAA